MVKSKSKKKSKRPWTSISGIMATAAANKKSTEEDDADYEILDCGSDTELDDDVMIIDEESSGNTGTDVIKCLVLKPCTVVLENISCTTTPAFDSFLKNLLKPDDMSNRAVDVDRADQDTDVVIGGGDGEKENEVHSIRIYEPIDDSEDDEMTDKGQQEKQTSAGVLSSSQSSNNSSPMKSKRRKSVRFESPQPSTSNAKDVRTPSRKNSRRRPTIHSSSSDESNNEYEEEDEDSYTPSPPKKRNTRDQRKKKSVRLIETDEDCDSEASTTSTSDISERNKAGIGRKSLRSNKKRTEKNVDTSGSDVPNTRSSGKGNGIKTRRKSLRSSVNKKSSENNDHSSDSDVPTSRTMKRSRSKAKASQKSLRSSSKKKKSEKDDALDKLTELMEKRKEKNANRKSPEREFSKMAEDSDESSTDPSDPNFSDFIVDEEEYSKAQEGDPQYNGGSDSDSSSSSSVTSGCESEEPDLGSGDEGEQDIEQEPPLDLKDEDSQTDGTSSSSADEEPDDGQNDTRCALCKNLGSQIFTGRSKQKGRNWCKCGKCDPNFAKEAAHDYDLICCKELFQIKEFMKEEIDNYEDHSRMCIVEHPRFADDVLHNQAYVRSVSDCPKYKLFQGGGAHAFYEYSYSANAERDRLRNRALGEFSRAHPDRKYQMCLRSFKHWVFGILRYDEPMVVPVCVHKVIREHLCLPDSHFLSFMSRTKCPSENGKHCKKTYLYMDTFSGDE